LGCILFTWLVYYFPRLMMLLSAIFVGSYTIWWGLQGPVIVPGIVILGVIFIIMGAIGSLSGIRKKVK